MERVQTGEKPPYRPDGALPSPPEANDKTISQLMVRCWEEDPAQRPALSEVKRILRDINKGRSATNIDICVYIYMYMYIVMYVYGAYRYSPEYTKATYMIAVKNYPSVARPGHHIELILKAYRIDLTRFT